MTPAPRVEGQPGINKPVGYYCFGWWANGAYEHKGCGYLTPEEYEEHKKKFGTKRMKVSDIYHTEFYLA